MSTKLTKRQIQAQNTQEKIYRIAIELIEKKGFENITVAEIAKTSGVSVGSFYNCFQSKHDILDKIFKVADDYFLNVVANDLKEGTTQDKIIRFFHYYANYNIDRGLDFVKQLYTVKNNLFATKGRHMQTTLQTIIEEGQKNGDITTSMTSEEIVDYLFIAVRGGVYNWSLHDGQYDLCDFMDKYVALLIKAL
ncbi:transcriptional regulator, TetR family [Anaerovirgula multivorans]|uniref:Transcriptional regulator, TetR family n=1 Tax=Anaerovirgula multivorans TaxID=312168 RepID=A0A239FS46_9FIRM|nr:TetR/AcrR family transcriptional regulator [Anaerovirgula multivorans]SNS59787.1 transcriptional regulator, TetR family [Anaerovirgula multivorans]